jgi:hypothetical protein
MSDEGESVEEVSAFMWRRTYAGEGSERRMGPLRNTIGEQLSPRRGIGLPEPGYYPSMHA